MGRYSRERCHSNKEDAMRDMMRTVMITAIGLLSFGCTTQHGHQASSSVIGESLDGWECYLADQDAKVQDVWRIQDGVLICTGRPLGYLYPPVA